MTCNKMIYIPRHVLLVNNIFNSIRLFCLIYLSFPKLPHLSDREKMHQHYSEHFLLFQAHSLSNV